MLARLRLQAWRGGRQVVVNLTDNWPTPTPELHVLVSGEGIQIMASGRGFLRRTAKRAIQAIHETGFPVYVDGVAFRLSRAAEYLPTAHLLIAPPGEGNIGDQAMVESFLQNTAGPVRILANNVNSVRIPAEHIGSTEVVLMPNLIYGKGLKHLHEVRQLRGLLSGAKSVSVVGADIMDGAYNSIASQRRAFILQTARRLDLNTRVLGFSWNGTSNPASLRALKRAAQLGAKLMLRDSTSAARAKADGLQAVSLVSDLVFSATDTDRPDAIRVLGSDNSVKALAIVNVSGLISKEMNQVPEYVSIVNLLVQSGRRVLLLPHVARPGGDDREACHAVWEATAGPNVSIVDELLAPATVRALVKEADVVVTGRMHLAIISLSQGVPALTLSTQGKVEGLMKQMGIPDWCIEPKTGFGLTAAGLLSTFLENPSQTYSVIATNLPEIQRLSRLNFVDMGT
jgi:colanic acid/amylovoran biosynthesis protein